MQVTGITNNTQTTSFGNYLRKPCAETLLKETVSKLDRNSLVRQRYDALTKFFRTSKNPTLFVTTEEAGDKSLLRAEKYDGDFVGKPVFDMTQRANETVQNFINRMYNKFVPKK